MPSVDGIISGIDTGSIISQLLAAARGPIRSMEGQIARLETRKSRLQELNGLLDSLKTALASVDTAADLPAYQATSSNPSAVGASVTGSPTPGSHDVGVVQLARASIESSNDFTSPTDTLQEATLDITVGTTTTTIDIKDANGNRTLQGLADYVNANVEGVSAYVLNVGSGPQPYRLIVNGDGTGAANDVSTAISYGPAGGTPLVLFSLQDAEDAHIKLDSIDVFTATNAPVDLIPGLTLDLKDVTTSDARIVVGHDPAAMAAGVQAVVDAYNEIVDFFAANIGIDADVAIAGDQTVRTVQRQLQSVLSAGYGTSNIAGLNSIGIGSEQDGHLAFDSADFTSMLSTDFDGVLEMLTGSGGLFGDLYTTVDTTIDPVTGLFQPRIDSIDDQVEALNDSITDAEYRLDKYEEILRAQFTQMESLLAQYRVTGDFLTSQLALLNND